MPGILRVHAQPGRLGPAVHEGRPLFILRAVPPHGSQEDLHQAYLDASKRLKEMTRGGAERADLARQRVLVDRAKAIWHKAVQAQKGAMRGRGR